MLGGKKHPRELVHSDGNRSIMRCKVCREQPWQVWVSVKEGQPRMQLVAMCATEQQAQLHYFHAYNEWKPA